MTVFDASGFELQVKGNKLEDFEPGRTFTHHWGRTFTHGDSALFTTAMCDWNPLYGNVEHARSHGHPDVLVNPMQVLCTVVGLSVEDLSEAGGPFLGIEDCTFHRPVHPGDTLTARSTVLDARPSGSRPDAGIVTWHTEGHNQRGQLVIDLVRSNIVARRGTVNAGLAGAGPRT